MSKPLQNPNKPQMVWRYMSFSRFVWLLEKKVLWLSRADLLGDPWEIALAGAQLEHVLTTAPPGRVDSPPVGYEKKGNRYETERERAERIIRMWRQQTFVNCWSSCPHESHALWRIYCRSDEGVAIQTTLPKLKSSVGDREVLPVVYEQPGRHRKTPTHSALVTSKRPMFAYEQEVRIVDWDEDREIESEIVGRGVPWDPEEHLESIRTHPDADKSHLEILHAVVKKFAPKLA